MVIRFPHPRLQGVAKLSRCASTARYGMPRYTPTVSDHSAPNRPTPLPPNATPQAVVDGLVQLIFEHSPNDDAAQARIVAYLTDLARRCVAETEARP